MSEIAEEIARVMKTYRGTAPLEHPQYIDGYLYVTKPQYDALILHADDRPSDDRPLLSIAGIPILIINPGQQVVRKDKSALFCTRDGELYSMQHPTPLHVAYQQISAGMHEYTKQAVKNDEAARRAAYNFSSVNSH